LSSASRVGQVDETGRRVVLGGGADHGGPADVDVLERVLERGIRAGDRLAEGVEVVDDDVDGRNLVATEFFEVLGLITPGEDAAVDHRVERLDAAVEDLRKAGERGD
jgi:hypothetical protein